MELDVVERLEVGRIADRDVEAFAALEQRQNPVLREQLLVDELDDVEVEVERVEVEQGHAELVRGRRQRADTAGLRDKRCGRTFPAGVGSVRTAFFRHERLYSMPSASAFRT